VVADVYSSDLIISDECPELLDFFHQTSPTEHSAFTLNSPVSTSDSNMNVYQAWQPLIVLCSNALRYEFFGQQAETGKIIDFSSKPCGPYKLARSLLFCLEQAETRRHSIEELMEVTTLTSPPSRLETSASSQSTNPESHRRGSFGKGVVRLSPAVRRGSSDIASMYLPGRGFVHTKNASIVEPPEFVGMRRKLTNVSPNVEVHDIFAEQTIRDMNSAVSPISVEVLAPTTKPDDHFAKKEEAAGSVSPYNRYNPLKSMPMYSASNHPPLQAPQSHCPHVLIVEDNFVNALILETFLRKRGYPFSKAENGLLAVKAVQSRPDGFNVILMDIQSTPFSHAVCLS